MLWTKRGYSSSVIFSLLAKSRARSKGILCCFSESAPIELATLAEIFTLGYLPDTLQVHGADLDYVADLLAFEDTITATARHTSDVKELSAVNHMVIYSRVN